MSQRRNFVIAVALGIIACCTSAGMAQFSALQQMLFRNIEYGGNRNFISSPQGGPLFDNNIYDQRIEFNRLGQGFTFDQFRFFGPDSFDNPNTIDLGPLKVQLGRDPTVLGSPQPVGVHNRVGYTTTGIPEVFFSTRTGQRSFDVFSGQTNFSPAPLNYRIDVNTGIENIQYNGNMLIDTNGKINGLGFYDYTMQITNIGNATADGVLLKDEKVTDFDTGPVHVTGNILFDGIASFFQANGTPVAASPFRILSGATAKDSKKDELIARLNNGEKLSNDDMSFLMSEMIMTAFHNDPIGFLTNGIPKTVPGFEGLSLNTFNPPATGLDPSYVAASAASGQQGQTGSTDGALSSPPVSTTVPEPGTLLLLAAAASGGGVLRRRSARRKRSGPPA